MNYHRQFRRAAIEQGIPEEAVARFAGHLRFAIWLRARPGEVVARSGGLPRLPVGTAWPATSGEELDERLPLPFIASLDCAALPRVDGFDLPVDGSLLFFLEHEYASEEGPIEDAQEYARVVHVPAGIATTVVDDLPTGHDGWALNEECPFVRDEFELSATVQPELPSWLTDRDSTALEHHLGFESPVVQQLYGELTHLDELRTLVDELWPSDGSGAVIYLGGYTMELGIGDNPESRMADAVLHARGEADDRLHAQETRRLMLEWVPLAQFGTSSDVHYGQVLIRHEDLAARRFDKVTAFATFTE